MAYDYDYDFMRNKMVDEQLVKRGIESASVLDAMRTVPRHLFVPDDMQRRAYDDSPLPIGLRQTISQPYIVGFMTDVLELAPGMSVLEIGTGSGYQAAILSCMGCVVYTIELLELFATKTHKTLKTLKIGNVKVKHGNGYLGWPEYAPFDAILVTAAPQGIPGNLVQQLKDGGKMVVPIGEVQSVQNLKLFTKTGAGLTEKILMPVRFVPMVNTVNI